MNLQEIKDLDSGLSYDKYKYIEDKHIDWLIEQAEKVEMLEKQWYLLKIELEQRRDFEERCNGEDEINLIDDIDSIMQKLESGDYFK